MSGTPIGPGLFISHGQGTILSAERIGSNLQVHQGVTVGWDYKGDRRPIIGNDVFIGAGAKVLGAVTIGDGARIGANAVVVCDVPPGATAVGIPARIKAPLGC
jgi:serine O-acetyltransferase